MTLSGNDQNSILDRSPSFVEIAQFPALLSQPVCFIGLRVVVGIIRLAVFERFTNIADYFRRIDRFRDRAAQDEFLNEFAPGYRGVAPVGLKQYFIRSDDLFPGVAEPHQQVTELVFLAAVKDIRVARSSEFSVPSRAWGEFVPERRLQYLKVYLRPVRAYLHLLAHGTGLFRGSNSDLAPRLKIILR